MTYWKDLAMRRYLVIFAVLLTVVLFGLERAFPR